MKISFEDYKKLSSNEYWIDSEDGLKANVVDNIVYLLPSNMVRAFPADLDDENKKQFKHKKGIDNLQWIY